MNFPFHFIWHTPVCRKKISQRDCRTLEVCHIKRRVITIKDNLTVQSEGKRRRRLKEAEGERMNIEVLQAIASKEKKGH